MRIGHDAAGEFGRTGGIGESGPRRHELGGNDEPAGGAACRAESRDG